MTAHRDKGLCIGLDVGTSGVKAILVAADGTVVATAGADYPLLTPQPGWTEQEPEAWWRASCAVLRKLRAAAPGPIAALGLTGQMHGAVFLAARRAGDPAGDPLERSAHRGRMRRDRAPGRQPSACAGSPATRR